MIEIEEPPDFHVKACGACMRPILWLANLDTGRVFAAVVDETDRTRILLHRCRPLQEPITWRALQASPGPGQSAINAAGRARAEAQIKNSSKE